MEFVSQDVDDFEGYTHWFGLFSLEMPLWTTYQYLQTMFFFDAFDLADEMPAMTEEPVEEDSINSTDVMVDHLMNQQFSKHFLI